MLLDSNIIIYASLPEFPQLRTLIVENSAYVSAISYVEVLGYHKLSPAENTHFTTFLLARKSVVLAKKQSKLRKISRGNE